MTFRVTIEEAQSTLAELIKAAISGKEIIILRGKVPVAKLVGIKQPMRRRPGALKGKLTAAPDAFDPISTKELKRWGI